MKTYENFITDLFRKFPKKIKQLENTLINFINKNIHEANWYAVAETNNNIISIKINNFLFHTRQNAARQEVIKYDLIRLYYNYNTKEFIYHIITPKYAFESDNEDINNMREFLENNMLSILNDGPVTQLISLDKIQNIINNITQDNYDQFVNMKKYNL